MLGAFGLHTLEPLDHSVNIAPLLAVVSKYVDQYHLMAAAGPLAGAALARFIWGQSKILGGAVKATAIWFAVRELAGPLAGLVSDQSTYLNQVVAMFRG